VRNVIVAEIAVLSALATVAKNKFLKSTLLSAFLVYICTIVIST
jgi:hypothetical protein